MNPRPDARSWSKVTPLSPSGQRPLSKSGWPHFAREHLHFLLPFVIVLLVSYWFLTFGTWRLFEREGDSSSFAERFYDAQAVSLLHGRFDVPPEAIGFEAFIHEGKHYGYFGLGPALLRVPLFALFPSLEGRLNRVIILLACAINLIVTYQLLRRIRLLYRFNGSPSALEKMINGLYVLLVGLGSTSLFLVSRSFVYHEAIMLGATFALLFFLSFINYSINGRLRTLLFACGCAFLCFMSRASIGIGPLLVLTLFVLASLPPMTWLAVRIPLFAAVLDKVGLKDVALAPRAIGHVCLAGVSVALIVGFSLGVNYAKFGTISSLPLSQYVAFQYFDGLNVYERIEGKAFHVVNVRAGLYNYFWPGKIEFANNFPWIYLMTDVTSFPEAKLGWEDWWSSFSASMPALLALALFGLYMVFAAFSKTHKKLLRLPLLGALVAGAAIIVHVSYAERYLHDCYPLLVVAGAAGLQAVLLVRSASVRRLICASLIPLTFYSVCIHAAFALVYQRDITVACGFSNQWSAEKAEEFHQWRAYINDYISGSASDSKNNTLDSPNQEPLTPPSDPVDEK